MKSSFLNCVALALLMVSAPHLSGAQAAGISSSEKLELKVEQKDIDEDSKILWNRFGNFCEIAEWHPAILSCTEGKEDGAVYRTLSLKDGEKIKEKLLSQGPTNYRYAIVESPLPVKNYEAEFSVSSANGQLAVGWSATSDPADGKSEKDARDAIDGVIRAGIAGIKTKLPDMQGAGNTK